MSQEAVVPMTLAAAGAERTSRARQMYLVILASQWRWSRIVVVAGTLVGFAIPLFSIQGAARGEAGMASDALLAWLQSWGILYPLLAALLGLLVAIGAWAPDHRGRHVHALSLPVPRWQYVLLRFLAGLTVLLLPMLGVVTGAVLASHVAVIPTGLQTYAWALALRFALATVVAFAMFFAISGGTTRTAGLILAIIGLLVALQFLLSTAGVNLNLGSAVLQLVFNWPGPMAIFAGRWMLIDV